MLNAHEVALQSLALHLKSKGFEKKNKKKQVFFGLFGWWPWQPGQNSEQVDLPI